MRVVDDGRDPRRQRSYDVGKRVSEHWNKKNQSEALEKLLSFEKTPKEIKAYLDEYVIGQELGKKVLAVGISYHYVGLAKAIKKAMDERDGKLESDKDLGIALSTGKFIKQNILIVGPSGCGKTYSMEKISDYVNVPMVIEDLTKFSASGYVGRDAEEIGLDLMKKSQNNPMLARFGIVFLDEIDKIKTTNTIGKDVSGGCVQESLLKIVEGAEFNLPTHLGGGMFSSKYTLFIAGGAYEGLKEKVEQRMRLDGLNPEEEDWGLNLTNHDLMRHGMERQLLGRFPIKVVYKELTQNDLVEIMKRSKDSPIRHYERMLGNWGIKLDFKEDAMGVIAEYAANQGIGARGNITAISKIMNKDLYELPKSGATELVVDKQYVEDRLSSLSRGNENGNN